MTEDQREAQAVAYTLRSGIPVGQGGPTLLKRLEHECDRLRLQGKDGVADALAAIRAAEEAGQ